MTRLRHNARNQLCAIAVACAVATGGCSKPSLPQSRNLDGETRVVLEDVWLLDHTPRLLDVLCTYEGPNPNRRYELDAVLSDQSDGGFFKRGWTKQLDIPQPDGTSNEVQVLWQFGGFPKDTKHIYLRLRYRDRKTGQKGALDFELPGTRRLRVRELGSR